MKQMQRVLFGQYSFSVALGKACVLPLLPVAQFAEVRNPIVLQGRG